MSNARERDRDAALRPRNARPRDALGRPLPYDAQGVQREPEGTVRAPAAALAEAYRLLADDMPFHAHEVLEDAWKAAPDAERELWRGLAQLAVASTHAARGNRAGALALLDRGATGIATYREARPHALDIDAILAWVDTCVVKINEGVPVTLPPAPLASA
ncbi:MAG: DUF309 domain-containing protein [Actinomycetota bacterium]|nr:DUF309 domain-containing protein [Actinomycetota bacterium]